MLNKFVRLSAIVGTIFLAGKFFSTDDATTAFQTILSVNGPFWIALILLSIFVFALLALMFQASIKVIDVDLSFNVSFNYTSMNTFFNTILPMKGGLWIRGAYLHEHYNVQWEKYLFVVFTSQIAQIALLICFVSLTMLSCDIQLNFSLTYIQNLDYLAIGLISILCTLLVFFISKTMIFKQVLRQLKKGLKLWFRKPALASRFITLAIIMNIATGLRLWLAFLAAGHAMTIAEIITIYCLLTIGLSWAFTPGNIGVKEAATVFISSLLSIDITTALTASILDRAASLGVIIIVGGFAAHRASRALN